MQSQKYNPLISVVITTYNYGQYLLKAIDSVLDQTYKNYEIVVVNDGSTDNTDELIKCYTSRNNFHYINQKNSGQAIATNNGILESSGEFVAFLDADDYWAFNKLAEQIKLFENNNNLGVVYSSGFYVNENYQLIMEKIVKRIDGNFIYKLLLENFIIFSSSLIRKECFNKSGMLDPNLRVCTDYDLWLRISKHYSFDCVEEPLVYYMVKENRLSSNADEMFETAHRLTEEFVHDNKSLLSPEIIKQEKLISNFNRFYTYNYNKEVKKALKYLKVLVVSFPFSKLTLRAIFILITPEFIKKIYRYLFGDS